MTFICLYSIEILKQTAPLVSVINVDNLSENDIARKNTIANLLKDWGLVEIIGDASPVAPLSQIKVLSYKEKDDWILETKYNIGKKKEA